MNIKGSKIIAITGCAAGIAHTYMAAEGIEKAAKELGAAKVKVETHGTGGPENVFSPKDVREADIVIIAADIAVNLDRFVGKVLYQTGTNDAIIDGKKLINDAFQGATKYKVTAGLGGSSVVDTGNIQKKGNVMPHIMYALS